MARPQFLLQESGLAADGNIPVNEPLRLISRPLYLPTDQQIKLSERRWKAGWEQIDPNGYYRAKRGEPALDLDTWQLPPAAAGDDHYEKLLARQKAFAVGGTQFVVEMGMIADWFTDDDRRKAAIQLMSDRKWTDLLTRFSDKEQGLQDIFGKNAVADFLRALPPAKDRGEIQHEEVKKKEKSPRRGTMDLMEIWHEHRVRLRKALEFIALVEAIVAWRFSNDKSGNRFRLYLGEPGAELNAQRILDILWIEPLIFSPWPEPREPDVQKIWESQVLRDQFQAQSGESNAGPLYWVLRGAPSKLKTVQAACNVCGAFYGSQAVPTRPVTVPPTEFRQRRNWPEKTASQNAAPPDARGQLPNLIELGPVAPVHAIAPADAATGAASSGAS